MHREQPPSTALLSPGPVVGGIRWRGWNPAFTGNRRPAAPRAARNPEAEENLPALPAYAGPDIVTTPLTQTRAGEEYVYHATARDASVDGFNWSLQSSPSGMTVDLYSGKVTWTPSTKCRVRIESAPEPCTATRQSSPGPSPSPNPWSSALLSRTRAPSRRSTTNASASGHPRSPVFRSGEAHIIPSAPRHAVPDPGLMHRAGAAPRNLGEVVATVSKPSIASASRHYDCSASGPRQKERRPALTAAPPLPPSVPLARRLFSRFACNAENRLYTGTAP